jgi:hypothetical protein
MKGSLHCAAQVRAAVVEMTGLLGGRKYAAAVEMTAWGEQESGRLLPQTIPTLGA